MTTDHTWLSREDLGLPKRVTNSNGVTPRPAMAPHTGCTVVHWTGMDLDFSQGVRYWVPRIESSAQRLGKSNEYNYVIDRYGVIAEYAGTYRAAHCRNHNDLYGVLMLNGPGDPLTDAQVDSFRFWQQTLRQFGFLALRSWVLPHQTLAATACPGPEILKRFPQLDRPHVP